MICILLECAGTDRHWLFEAVEPGFDFRGSRSVTMRGWHVEDAGSGIRTYVELIAGKRAEPADDMRIRRRQRYHHDDPGRQLSDARQYLFFHLLFGVGRRRRVEISAWRRRAASSAGLPARQQCVGVWPRSLAPRRSADAQEAQ